MADTNTAPATEPQQRGVDPGKVIAKMAARLGEREQELAVAYTLVEDLEEIVAGLQAELATATAGKPVAAKAA